MHLIVHIIQRSIHFHHNWLGEYINMSTFLLLISCQNLLDHSVKFPGNRTARFPIDWPRGKEKSRGWGHKKRRLQMPIYSPLIAIHEFLFPKRIFRNQRPPSLWRRRGSRGLHPIQWQSAAMSYGNITAQCSINMSPSSRNRKRKGRREERERERTVARFWSLIVRLGSSKRMMRALHAASGWIQGHRDFYKRSIIYYRHLRSTHNMIRVMIWLLLDLLVYLKQYNASKNQSFGHSSNIHYVSKSYHISKLPRGAVRVLHSEGDLSATR